MGLISDPRNQQKILHKILLHHRAAIYVLIAISVIGWLALPITQVSQGDHVQENALQTGLDATTCTFVVMRATA